jgi:ribose-phosphate pyrophosphokinase
MELVLSADALKRASARSITAVIPYFAYSRQEKKGGVRGPISARAVADMLQSVGVDRVVTLDIHAEAIEGFFSIPFDNLAAFPLMVPHLVTKYGSDKITLVSPDAGGMSRVVAASQILSRYIVRMDSSESLEGESPIRIEGMYKRRARPNEVAEMRFIGDGDGARDATCILVDDIYDTGGSALTAARALRDAGAKRVVICMTHPIFSKGGLENCRASQWDDGSPLVHEIVTTDSLPLRRAQGDLVTVVSSQSLLAEAIRRICCGQAASLRELQGFCGLTD